MRRALPGTLLLAATSYALASACSESAPSAPAAPVDAGEITTPDPVVCDPAAILPTDLRCTGLYADFATRALNPEARAYTPALTFWSDGAEKRRWLYLPPGSKIDTSNMDEWVFPVGTKVWKEFTIGGKTIETRLFSKIKDGQWVFTAYAWDADGSRATRIDAGKPSAAGNYEIPSRTHCSQCHNGHADRLLGVEAVSLGLPQAQGITLATLASEGRLTVPPRTTTLALPGDALTQRALGYLHVNCGTSCHSPNAAGTAGFTGMLVRINAKTLLEPVEGGPVTVASMDAYRTTVGKDFVSAQYVDDDRFNAHKRIVAGDPTRSLVHAAMSMRGVNQMPPIVSHEVDVEGARLLADWITSVR